MESIPTASNGQLKRARHVCQRCHRRKVKCDIRLDNGSPTRCTRCCQAGSECLLRTPKRLRSRSKDQNQHDLRDERELHRLLSMDEIIHQPRLNILEPTLGDRTQLQRNRIDIPSPAPPASPEHTPHRDRITQDENSCDGNARCYLGQSGFMPLLHQTTMKTSTGDFLLPGIRPRDLRMSSPLKAAFVEAYHEYCFSSYPILDRTSFFNNPVFAESTLLQQALAVVGSRVNPPFLPHDDPHIYYQRAKTLFYSSAETNPVVRIISVIMLQWWSSGPPNRISLDSQFIWTGLAIRLMQEIGLYREPTRDHILRPGESLGLRRRIFWTLFARERIFALCQGRPCLINLEDCDIRRPSIEDFPGDQAANAEIFIHYVQLSDIIGRLSRRLALQNNPPSSHAEFAMELLAWAQSLPQHLLLPFDCPQTLVFHRDVHWLHLPYLAALILLYSSPSANSPPTASTTAILSASLVGRILQDFLARGAINFVTGVGGWYITIAILVLSHARQIECLKEHANEQIEILMLALQQVSKSWHSAEIFLTFLEKHLKYDTEGGRKRSREFTEAHHSTTPLSNLSAEDGFDAFSFFPRTSPDTTEIFKLFHREDLNTTLTAPLQPLWPENLPLSWNDFLGQFDSTLEQIP